ncbi:MAG: tetratricopeptide repeat protein [Deltaproteobacteria bacterium]|nr:tetratricopeptide repeat protein [Deltaproteobacteria bacterium]
MAKKKRLTRKQLLKEPDEFLTFSAKAMQFVRANRKTVSFILCGLFLLVLVTVTFRYFSNRSENRAYAKFEQGFAYYLAQTRGEKSADLQKTLDKRLGEIVEKYPSTTAGQLSLLLYADASYREGSYDRAIELYQRALKTFSHEHMLRKLILNGLGYAYEGKKDYRNAIQAFRSITDTKGKFMKPDAYFNLGRMNEAIKNKEKAIKAYEIIVESWPESLYFDLVREKIRCLKEAKPASG